MKPALSPPLQALEQMIITAFVDIEAWLHHEYAKTPPPFYCSTDLRNNGNKIAPVDTNLFPGGFNNLSPANYPLAAQAIRHQIDMLYPGTKSLLVIPENHSRNLLYLDNIATLKQLLEMAGVHVQLGRLNAPAQTLTSANGTALNMLPLENDNGRLHCKDFYPCAVLLNNDLSDGLPPLLQDTTLPLLLPAQMGWWQRKKSQHFSEHNKIAEKFAATLNTDPWLFSTDFHVCRQVDFHKREGMECLATAVDEILQTIQEKYRQHNITDTPYVVIKANAGTYGMGVMMVHDAAEVFNLNRRQRNRMSAGKAGAKINDVLIQEGITTIEKSGSSAAEPVVYMIGRTVIGGFYRVNASRSSSDNLNSGGMSFTPLPFETNCAPSVHKPDPVAARLYLYSVIGRLANLAAAREIQTLTTQHAATCS